MFIFIGRIAAALAFGYFIWDSRDELLIPRSGKDLMGFRLMSAFAFWGCIAISWFGVAVVIFTLKYFNPRIERNSHNNDSEH